MLDPANHYHSIHLDGEYVGYVCVGADAETQHRHTSQDTAYYKGREGDRGGGKFPATSDDLASGR